MERVRLPLAGERATPLEAGGARENSRSLRVALVSMPFAPLYRPSIQLGLLASIARQCGFNVETIHLHLDFAKVITPQLYMTLADHSGFQLGDWLFSLEAFRERAPDISGTLLDDFGDIIDRNLAQVDANRETLRRIRAREVPRFMDLCTESEPWMKYDVVGFTCTFQQTVASLAMARRIKEEAPSTICVFGGANFEGEMGRAIASAAEEVDYAVDGEGDRAFPALLHALATGRSPVDIPGVIARRDGRVVHSAPDVLSPNLDLLPTPSYDEYFARARRLELITPANVRETVVVPFETARGCWWGAKHHCTFCGLNGSAMAFRSKSPERVLRELCDLVTASGVFEFAAVDNILDHTYIETLFASLREHEIDFNFFCEVKANLTRAQVRGLSQGGVRVIQPGIESLNTHVLRIMRKGTTSLQNINLLRWASYYGVAVAWNLIWGFPGERPEDNEQQERLVETIHHLAPPQWFGRVWMERNSPMFMQRNRFPARFLRPEASYGRVFPSDFNLAELAFFFDYELEDTLTEDAYLQLRQRLQDWRERWSGPSAPTLTFSGAPGIVTIDDRRPIDSVRTTRLVGASADCYRLCSDRPRSVADVSNALSRSIADIEAIVDALVDARLMVREGAQVLSLALPSCRMR